MAKKEARISINKLESVMRENIVVVPLSGADGVDITIRRRLPLKDMMQFVENVVSSCIDAETATYTPEIKEFVIRSEILTTYANFNLPTNAEKQYELVYGTNALEQVMEHIDRNQFYEIEEAIDARIEHEVKIMETVVSAKTNEMFARIENMVSQFETMFGGLNSNDFNGVIRNIARLDGMTEESIAKAVLGVQRSEKESAGSQSIEEDKVISFPKNKKE